MKKNTEIVSKTTNEVGRSSHVIPFPWLVVRASPNAQHTPQTIIPVKVKPFITEKRKTRL